MPVHLEDGEDLQIFVSQYSLDKILETIVDLELFKYTLDG